MQSWFTFELDGEECRIEKEDTHRTLAAFLPTLDPCFRRFKDTDPWKGGNLVVLGDIEEEQHRFRVADAGLLLLPMLAGRQVWTPEGIQSIETDHPVSLALHDRHFECSEDRTASLVALLFEGYYRPDLRRQGQTNDQFDGIVTRTACVPAIREAAAQVFASTEQLRHEAAIKAEKSGQESSVWTGTKDIFGDRFTKKLFQIKKRTPLQYVDEQKRRFHRPGSLTELMKLRKEYPSAHLIAGGTELATLSGSVEWPSLISLEAVRELNLFLTSEEEWEIGAMVPLTRIAEQIGRECPAFSKILRRFGARAIRNRATLGGYLANGWKRGQLTPLLMALNARVILISEDGERDAPLSQYFEEAGGTILQSHEIIRSIIIPRSTESVLSRRGITNALCDTYSVAPRRTLSEPYGTGAFSIELRDKKIAKAQIAYSGIEKSPRRIREAEEFLAGKSWTEKTVFACLPLLIEEIEVDGESYADYRKQLVVTLLQKFFAQHPTPEQKKPITETAVTSFFPLDEPFFDALPTES